MNSKRLIKPFPLTAPKLMPDIYESVSLLSVTRCTKWDLLVDVAILDNLIFEVVSEKVKLRRIHWLNL